MEGEDGHVQISPRGVRGQEGQGSPNYLAEDFSLRVLGRLIIVYTLTHFYCQFRVKEPKKIKKDVPYLKLQHPIENSLI